MRQPFNKQFSPMAIYIILLLVFSTGSLYSRIIFNRGDSVFAGTAENAAAVCSHIVTGAGYFLASGSEFQALLNRIELAETNGCDYKEWAQICTAAAANMEKAAAQYLVLKQRILTTPYNKEMINRLSTFDYDLFETGNRLNPDIFADVRTYLANGDVRGIFERMLSSTAKILAALARVKTAVDAGIIPELTVLWRLNQEYTEAMLFGQYAAEVFYQIN